MKKATYYVVIIILLIATANLSADIYVEKKSRTINDNANVKVQEWIVKMWISDNQIRVEEPDGKITNITDFSSGKLVTLDHENKEFFIIPLQQITSDFARGAEGMKRNMTMGWRLEPPIVAGEIVSYPCKMVKFYGAGSINNNNKKTEINITMSIWFSAQVASTNNISRRLLEVMGLEKNPFISEAVLNEIMQLGGFHMKAEVISEIDGKKQGIIQEVTKLKIVENDPGRFSIPDGYREVASPIAR